MKFTENLEIYLIVTNFLIHSGKYLSPFVCQVMLGAKDKKNSEQIRRNKISEVLPVTQAHTASEQQRQGPENEVCVTTRPLFPLHHTLLSLWRQRNRLDNL